MNTVRGRKTTVQALAGGAGIALLLMSSASLFADEKDKKDPNKDAASKKTAPAKSGDTGGRGGHDTGQNNNHERTVPTAHETPAPTRTAPVVRQTPAPTNTAPVVHETPPVAHTNPVVVVPKNGGLPTLSTNNGVAVRNGGFTAPATARENPRSGNVPNRTEPQRTEPQRTPVATPGRNVPVGGHGTSGASTVNRPVENTTPHQTDNRTNHGANTNHRPETNTTIHVTIGNTGHGPIISAHINRPPVKVHDVSGGQAHYRTDTQGHRRITEFHKPGLVITHNRGGARRIIAERDDHSRVVVHHFGNRVSGYVQRPFSFHNRDYVARTFYHNGHPYNRYYTSYGYRGIALHRYVPYRYYHRDYYQWTYRRWPTRVPYAWSWADSPWRGYYGFYFHPYRSYAAPYLWLTDYLLAANLQVAYEQQVAASGLNPEPPDASGPVVLSPEVKRQISYEVQRQLALENIEAQQNAQTSDAELHSNELPAIFARVGKVSPRDNLVHNPVFVVTNDLNVVDAEGNQYYLSAGDVLRLDAQPDPNASSAWVVAIASKNPDVRGVTVAVGFDDLQEMVNQMHGTVDQGLQELQAHPGDFPAPPSAESVTTGVAQTAPPPDADVENELQSEVKDADQTETQAQSELSQVDGD